MFAVLYANLDPSNARISYREDVLLTMELYDAKPPLNLAVGCKHSKSPLLARSSGIHQSEKIQHENLTTEVCPCALGAKPT